MIRALLRRLPLALRRRARSAMLRRRFPMAIPIDRSPRFRIVKRADGYRYIEPRPAPRTS